MGATNAIRIVGAQREFVLPRGAFTLRRAYASLIREAWPEGRLPLVEGEFGKSGDAGRRRSLAVVEKQ